MSERDHLSAARDVTAFSEDLAASPDARSVPYLLAGILDALVAIAERLPALPEPGICGDAPAVAGFPDHLPRPLCALKAGHAGAHSDGDGAHWTTAPTHRPDRDQTESEAEHG